MLKIYSFFMAIVLSVTLISCSTAAKKSEPLVAEKSAVENKKETIRNTNLETVSKAQPSTVWVSKSDGSKSCGTAVGIMPGVAAKELKKAGIRVHQFRKGSDGLMHTMQCGGSTGVTNEMEIDLDALSRAQSLGFQPILPQPN